jgi:hypothetical protein
MKDGGPAFPVPAELCQDLTVQEQRGMTLRDYFAAKAMQGMLANDIECGPEQVPIIVASAYVMADAMLAERSKT